MSSTEQPSWKNHTTFLTKKDFPYEILGLTDLKTRRERGDFIQIYKIVHSLEKVNWCDENKILRPEQNIESISALSLANIRKRADNKLSSQQNGDHMEQFALRH